MTSMAGIIEKHSERIHHGLETLPTLKYGIPGGLGNKRWTDQLILATYSQASTGKPPTNGLEYRVGNSGGGFDTLGWQPAKDSPAEITEDEVDLTISLNKRKENDSVARLKINLPIYGGGMSFG
ncbi:MAG TPA: hypothetical protein VE177_02715, partial [Candidatus Binatus sp.]|nr:hypothetical protein [Candidatus Binatus sp.]